MYDQEFWTKFSLRVAHMLGVISLGGGTIYDYYFPCENSGSRGSPIFLAIMGLLVIISGFANTFVLKPKQKMGNKASFWIACMHLKLLIVIIFLSPIFRLILQRFTENATQISKLVQVVLVIFWIVASAFLRFYREHWTEINRQKQVQ